MQCTPQQGPNNILQPVLPALVAADGHLALTPNPVNLSLDSRNRWISFPEELWHEGVATCGALPISRRGLHLAERPDMPRAARKARPHWADKVKTVRNEWIAVAACDADFRRTYAFWADFAERRVGGKLECLVRTLHLAAAADQIHPLRRSSLPASAIVSPPPPRDERKGRPPKFVSCFSDWAGFTIVRGEFRAAVWGLFPAGVLEATVVATLRQSGIAPEGWHVSPKAWAWDAAWAGEVAFVLRPQRRRCPAVPAVGQ